ncbi:hypothetical protein M231_05721 [Tremella mesenterica]|uniref:Uncharacterized protein n=1 Tax=Tremella mesenterica TaxID=5217 RepID=A0A4Q1BHE6_TREME|nr:hypothetical protein M231_05721 [Tremella mesenterica]
MKQYQAGGEEAKDIARDSGSESSDSGDDNDARQSTPCAMPAGNNPEYGRLLKVTGPLSNPSRWDFQRDALAGEGHIRLTFVPPRGSQLLPMSTGPGTIVIYDENQWERERIDAIGLSKYEESLEEIKTSLDAAQILLTSSDLPVQPLFQAVPLPLESADNFNHWNVRYQFVSVSRRVANGPLTDNLTAIPTLDDYPSDMSLTSVRGICLLFGPKDLPGERNMDNHPESMDEETGRSQ